MKASRKTRRECVTNERDATRLDAFLMLRPSSTAARPSHVPLGASQATSAAAKKVALKAKELAGVTALEGASELFLQRIESFCSDLEVMADSGAGE